MNVAITVAGHAAVHCSWSDFRRDNRDAFSDAELETMRRRLLRGESVNTGGGAAPLITLQKREG